MANRGRIIFLTGFSGTGKSTVGRIVADRLGWRLLDTDLLITQRAGEPIVEIFERGEEHFRQLERAVLAEVAAGDCKVVAAGGGVPVDEHNRELMGTSGVTVRLKASPETIYSRLHESRRETKDSDDRRGMIRPMLEDSDTDPPVSRIRRLLEQREGAYATADATVDTENLTLEEVADEVVEAWQRTSPAAEVAQ